MTQISICPFCDTENIAIDIFTFSCATCYGRYRWMTNSEISIIRKPTAIGASRILQKRLSEITDVFESGLMHYMRVEIDNGSL